MEKVNLSAEAARLINVYNDVNIDKIKSNTDQIIKTKRDLNDGTFTLEQFNPKRKQFDLSDFVWFKRDKLDFESDISGFGKAKDGAWDRMINEIKKQSMNTIIETGNDLFDEKLFQADLAAFNNGYDSKRAQYEREWSAAVAAYDVDAIKELNGKLNELIKLKEKRPVKTNPRYHSKEKITVPLSGDEALTLIHEANELFDSVLEKTKADMKLEWVRLHSIKDIPKTEWNIYRALAHAGVNMVDFIKNRKYFSDANDCRVIDSIINEAFIIAGSASEYNKIVEDRFEDHYQNDSEPTYYDHSKHRAIHSEVESKAFKAVNDKFDMKKLEYACGLFNCFARDFKTILQSECLIDETEKALETL